MAFVFSIVIFFIDHYCAGSIFASNNILLIYALCLHKVQVSYLYLLKMFCFFQVYTKNS